MSKISRRDFLKGAGVAALAVAAAGALTGCSKNDIPVIPGKTKLVAVCYTAAGVSALGGEEVTVAEDVKFIFKADLEKIPAGYALKKGEEKWEIQKGVSGSFVTIELDKIEEDEPDENEPDENEPEENEPANKVVTVNYSTRGIEALGSETVTVDVDAEYIYLDQLTKIPEGYEPAATDEKWLIESNNIVSIKLYVK